MMTMMTMASQVKPSQAASVLKDYQDDDDDDYDDDDDDGKSSQVASGWKYDDDDDDDDDYGKSSQVKLQVGRKTNWSGI